MATWPKHQWCARQESLKGNALAVLYELAVLGAPTDAILGELEGSISASIAPFGLRLGDEIAWHVCPTAFDPAQTKSAAAVFFGAVDAPVANLASLLRRGIPILPVVSDITKVHEEIRLKDMD